ncbi:MAG TPA: hypothetical protein VK369_00740 [Segetibacter sp.]|nr:hypothetical protein [Segetibacter sp.]
MIKLKIISFLLCMLMALQMLPAQEIGKMLCNNQWTEELPHGAGDDGGKLDTSTSFQKNFLPVSNLTGPSFIIETKARTYIHSSDQVPSNHSTDVVSPPPDVSPIV